MIEIPAITITWAQLVFIALYCMAAFMAFIVFSMNPFGGGPGFLGGLLMAIFWPFVIVLAIMIPIFSIPYEIWKGRQRK